MLETASASPPLPPFHPLMPVSEASPFQLRHLLALVAFRHGLTVQQMVGHQRCRTHTEARREFCAEAFACGKWSSTQIATVINRHHTTVLYHAGVLTRSPKK